MAEELLKLYAARKAVAGHVFAAGHALAGGVRGRVPVRPDRRPGRGDRGHQARHGVADAHGPPALRRRGLRQDRGGDARRVQGGDGRQAGGGPRADHRPGVPALRRRSRERFAGFPVRIDMLCRFRTQAEQKQTLARPRRRPRRHRHRHAPAAVEGRRVPRPRPARRRRGAAVRRGAQGEAQAAAQERSTCSR